jgi:hypothetical protein
MSHVCTGMPFLARLTRPVMGVSLTLLSLGGGLDGMGLFVMRALRFPPIDDDEAAEP